MSIARTSTILLFSVIVCLGSCSPAMPEDLDSLMKLMNSDDETTSVNASNRVSEKFGEEGLLHVLKFGGERARARAAAWLWKYRSEDVENALIGILTNESDVYLRTQAAFALAEMGSPRSVPALLTATKDLDPTLRHMSLKAVETIRARSEATPRK